ncbi:MFS transporter [Nocardioides sp. CFH 31398]|uniref:MFS transporter n=1 Tax=Nocardioides sp. CFH 31398 TaxID=2919579 RepID=UPI001F055E84|nr:MFS transporter [Nocardioides sp. CFH 31398]MCH1868943.1 MFS transporter [Nocardioides sp. CFH 31398]
MSQPYEPQGPVPGRDGAAPTAPYTEPYERPHEEPAADGRGAGGRGAGGRDGRRGRVDGEPRPGAASRGARATGRGARRAAQATGRAGRYAVRQARRASHAEGAGASGLSRLIEMHAFSTAGDAAVAIGLAGTLFFQVPTGEARSQVALFLGLTMLPFVIVAPLIGPFLDRFSHGRRWAIGSAMAVRAFLCWVLASAVTTESPALFAAALGVLVASKAYGVTRAAAVPRLRPSHLTLVKANGRTSLAGVVGVAISAPLAALAATFGAEWALRYGFVLFVVATVLAILLPPAVDDSAGEEPLTLTGSGVAREDQADVPTQPLRVGRDGRVREKVPTRVPPAVLFALLANCGPRWLVGFLTMFMAFLLREQPVADLAPELLLALVVGAAGAGNALGIALASVLKNVNPRTTVVAVLVADVTLVVLAAVLYALPTLVLLGLTAGLAQSLGKLSLDSTIQRDVPGRVQSSAFARSDTTLQLAWVLGGFVGIALPLIPRLGLGTAAVVLLAWAVYVLAVRRVPRGPVSVGPRP